MDIQSASLLHLSKRWLPTKDLLFPFEDPERKKKIAHMYKSMMNKIKE